MDRSQIVHARELLRNLRASALESGRGGDELTDCWRRFVGLLRRRGYFVSTPAEIEGALEEIRAVGEGFDLFELACALAAYDEACVDCLRIRPARALPELRRFAPPCDCGRHNGGSTHGS